MRADAQIAADRHRTGWYRLEMGGGQAAQRLKGHAAAEDWVDGETIMPGHWWEESWLQRIG